MYRFAKVTLVVAMLLAAGAIATVAQADIIDTFTATADTTIQQYAGYSNCNNGGSYNISSGVFNGNAWNSLLRFDVSSLDATPNIQVNSVTMRLFMDTMHWVPGASTPKVYAITAANAGWVEGNGSAGLDLISAVPVPLVGAACWNSKAYNQTAWAGSEGLATAGTDYVNTVLASATIVGGATTPNVTPVDFNFTGTSTQLTSLLKGWAQAGSSNPGLLLADPTGGLVLYYSSASLVDAGFRPQLIVGHSSVPEPGTSVLLVTGSLGLLCYAWRKRK